MRSFLLTIFYILLLSPTLSYARTAQTVIPGYTQLSANPGSLISQIDDRFLESDMISGEDIYNSALCGPVSASIGLASFRSMQGDAINSQTIFEELKLLNNKAIDQLQTSINNGFFTNHDLNAVIKLYVDEIISSTKVDIYEKDLLFDLDISLEDIQKISQVKPGFNSTFGIFKVEIPASASATNNSFFHFITVLSYSPETKEVVVADPFKPNIPIKGRVTASKEKYDPLGISLEEPLETFGTSNLEILGLSVINVGLKNN